jgi:hypothetical protein
VCNELADGAGGARDSDNGDGPLAGDSEGRGGMDGRVVEPTDSSVGGRDTGKGQDSASRCATEDSSEDADASEDASEDADGGSEDCP